MDLNKAKHKISLLQLGFSKGSNFNQAIDVALECMTLVQNISAVYNSTDEKEAAIFGVQDILDNYFSKGGDL